MPRSTDPDDALARGAFVILSAVIISSLKHSVLVLALA